MDFMAVVSLVLCSFGGGQRVPGVWWDESRRGSGLRWFGECGGWSGDYWFAFVRE